MADIAEDQEDQQQLSLGLLSSSVSGLPALAHVSSKERAAAVPGLLCIHVQEKEDSLQSLS